MKFLIPAFALFLALSHHLQAVKIDNIEELDDLALFSFSAFGDNNGRAGSTYHNGDSKGLGMSHLEPWIENNDEFCLGVGDHAQGGRTTWFEKTEDHPFWNNHYYPVVGDNCNQTDYFYGVEGNQAHWGRGWVMFKALNNFFERNTSIDQIEFRPVGSTPIQSSKSKSEPDVMVNYDDQLCEYYARRTQDRFTFHIIGLNIPDPGVLTPRSKTFMLNKLLEIASFKTDYDVVIVNAQKAVWVKRIQEKGQLSRSERDILMENADLILCGDDHQYRRQDEFDGDYDGNEAIFMNIGQPAYNTGQARGYLNFHMFDNPARFTVQYIVTEKKSWYSFDNKRKLHVGSYINPENTKGRSANDLKAFVKEINGPFYNVNWDNFAFNGNGDPHPSGPVVSFASPTEAANIGEGSDLAVTVNATDNDGTVDYVKLYKDGVELRQENGSPWNWSVAQGDTALGNLQAGSFTLRAVATDNDGNESEASITVNVVDGSTQVSFASPSGSVTLMEGDTLELEVSASDIDVIDRVFLYKDGVELPRSEGGAPYKWGEAGQDDPDLKNLQPGTFILTAKAVDETGDFGWSEPLTVTVLSMGDNLVLNGSFETGDASSWELGSGSSVVSEQNQHGSWSLKMTGGSNTRQTIALTPNTDYELSVWVLASGLTSGGVRFDTMDKFDSPTQTPGGTCQFNINAGDAQVWTKYTGTFNSASETSVIIRTYHSSMVGTAYFDNIQLIDLSGPPPNTAPVFTSIGVIAADEGVSYVYNATASDADGDTLTFSGVTIPSWLSIDALGLLSGTPGSSDVGGHSVVLRVSDGTDTADQSFTVTVNPAPDPYEEWKSNNNVTDDDGDDDGDGITNLMEYALGGNPKTAASGESPTVIENMFTYDFKFQRNEGGLTYTIEKSTDLVNWSDHITVTDTHGSVGSEATVLVAKTEASNGKLFLRLKVEN